MIRAHDAVARAVKTRRLVRPANCEKCGGEGIIEAAHCDYLLALEVWWLCQRCHRKWDSAKPKSHVTLLKV